MICITCVDIDNTIYLELAESNYSVDPTEILSKILKSMSEIIAAHNKTYIGAGQ